MSECLGGGHSAGSAAVSHEAKLHPPQHGGGDVLTYSLLPESLAQGLCLVMAGRGQQAGFLVVLVAAWSCGLSVPSPRLQSVGTSGEVD